MGMDRKRKLGEVKVTNLCKVGIMATLDDVGEGEEGNIEYLTEWPVTQNDTKSDETDVEPAAKKSKIVSLEEEEDDDSDDDEDMDAGVTARMAVAVWHRRRQRSGKGLMMPEYSFKSYYRILCQKNHLIR